MSDSAADTEDFYAFFNIRRDATPEEITRAYRRFSLVCHPDRHVDPTLKQQAEKTFNKARQAYSTLMDPHKRAIYDSLGEVGLEVDGWQLVERRFSPQEIREEYERLRRQRDEQIRNQRTNPTGRIELNFNASDLFQPYFDPEMETYLYLRQFPYVELTGMSLSQSVEAPVTTEDRLVLGGSIETKNGIGAGGLNVVWRRILNATMWTETSINFSEMTSCSCRLHRTFSKLMHGSAQLFATLVPNEGIRPGLELAMSRQLDKHYLGNVTLKLGSSSSISTSVAFDDLTQTRVVGAVVLGIPSSFLMLSYQHRFLQNEAKAKVSIRMGNIGAVCECSYDRKVSENNTAGISCRIHIPRGIIIRLRFARASQAIHVNIALCEDEVVPEAVIFGVLVPFATYHIVKSFMSPWLEKRRLKQLVEEKKKSASFIEVKKEEALEMVRLMRGTAERSRAQELEKKGLIILSATYGKLIARNEAEYLSFPDKIIDVSVPLQTMVENSKLILQASSKANLPGFYDPCLGEPKALQVDYQFADEKFRVAIDDSQALTLPDRNHLEQRNGPIATHP